MYKNKKIAALIFLREESSRVPKKNLRIFHGKPLFHEILLTLQNSRYLDEIIVNTPSEIIINDCHEMGIKVHERPDWLNNVKTNEANEIIDYENQISQLNNYEKDTKKFIDYGLYVLKNLSSFFNNAKVLTKQKILSSIFKEKLVFKDEEYRTPILNFGIELIYKSINVLEDNLNKNGRQSFDYLPLSTRGGT